jgi:hypothetical protein
MASLKKYTGPWSDALAAHLLRRTTYGVPLSTVKKFGASSLDACIEEICRPLGDPPPPINVNYEEDPDVPIGETWVDKGVNGNVNPYRTASLRGWSFELMLKSSTNIREKMTMFWHNHFVTADINDPRYAYKNIALLRSQAMGNFMELTKDVTIDPAMLVYLNGRDNTRQAPNENYARELMELFTLGKGNVAGPGDYTTFTELDVKEVARALTGWIDVRNNLPIRAQYQLTRHDTGTKKLSHRFGEAVIPNAGANEYKNVIDIIFQKPEVALFICRKLYRWFVGAHIDAQTEQDVIEPMAEMMRTGNYEVASAVKALLSSEHFYDECTRGGIIKNPVDFLLNPLNQLGALYPSDLALQYRVYGGLYQTSAGMQMGMYQAPSVAGWQPYYQAPGFYRLWLNATSLPARKLFTDGFAFGSFAIGTYRLQPNYLKILDEVASPENPDALIDQLSLLMFPKNLATNQKSTLKNFLTLGGGNTSWSNVYNTYKADPSNETKRNAVLNRLRPMYVYMMRMPEYHLS